MLKRPGLDIHHSLPPSFEIENEWSCVSTPSLYLNGVDRDDSSFCDNRSGHNMIIIFNCLFIYLFIEYLRSSSTTCTQDHKFHILHPLLAAAPDLLPLISADLRVCVTSLSSLQSVLTLTPPLPP